MNNREHLIFQGNQNCKTRFFKKRKFKTFPLVPKARFFSALDPFWKKSDFAILVKKYLKMFLMYSIGISL